MGMMKKHKASQLVKDGGGMWRGIWRQRENVEST